MQEVKKRVSFSSDIKSNCKNFLSDKLAKPSSSILKKSKIDVEYDIDKISSELLGLLENKRRNNKKLTEKELNDFEVALIELSLKFNHIKNNHSYFIINSSEVLDLEELKERFPLKKEQILSTNQMHDRMTEVSDNQCFYIGQLKENKISDSISIDSINSLNFVRKVNKDKIDILSSYNFNLLGEKVQLIQNEINRLNNTFFRSKLISAKIQALDTLITDLRTHLSMDASFEEVKKIVQLWAIKGLFRNEKTGQIANSLEIINRQRNPLSFFSNKTRTAKNLAEIFSENKKPESFFEDKKYRTNSSASAA